MDLFELFDLEVRENIMVQDVRTDKQVRNRYSYDVGEKLVVASLIVMMYIRGMCQVF